MITDAVPEADKANVYRSIKTLIAVYGKQIKRDLATRDNSIENLIVNNEWPPNGLKDIRDALNLVAPFIDSFKTINTILTKELIDQYLSILITAVYADGPQGRVGGIQSLTKAHGLHLISQCKFDNVILVKLEFIIYKLYSKYKYNVVQNGRGL
jgi:hypothetical protein